jgi:tetratricopeptide (TPR) repeat protein
MRTFIIISLLFNTVASWAQLTMPPGGGNKKASVSEQIGLTTVTVHYDRPGVKGREGKIWGTPIAHYGFQDLGYGPGQPAPWRAGANETTTITFSDNVRVEGKPLEAGTYGLFMNLGEQETTVIFSKIVVSWGSYYYDPAMDVLRVTVKNQPLDRSVELLTYSFINQTDSSSAVALLWEKRMIPFTVSVDLVRQQMASFRRELLSKPGFTWQSLVQAATYCLDTSHDLNQGLVWADQAMNARYVGQKNFLTLSTKAAILTASNKPDEAAALLKEAMPLGTMNELHQYGRLLLGQKRNQEAYAVFKTNYDKYPNQFTTNLGMSRALVALGKPKEALPYLQAALPQAPDALNKGNVEAMIKAISEGKSVIN